MNRSSQKPDPTAAKYICFRAGKDEFAMSVANLREIMGLQEIHPLTTGCSCVLGAINLRGKLVPVLDLRRKFELPETPPTNKTCIIIIKVQPDERESVMGLLVDNVSEVLTLAERDIDRRASSSNVQVAGCLTGSVRIKGRARMLLDIDRILSGDELKELIFP